MKKPTIEEAVAIAFALGHRAGVNAAVCIGDAKSRRVYDISHASEWPENNPGKWYVNGMWVRGDLREWAATQTFHHPPRKIAC